MYRRSSKRCSAWSNAASSICTRPSDRSSIQFVISKACIGDHDTVLNTSGSSVPRSIGIPSSSYLRVDTSRKRTQGPEWKPYPDELLWLQRGDVRGQVHNVLIRQSH